MGNSIVLSLQEEVTNQSCDIINVLRRAHLIAVKLELIEFDKWIINELNGYPPNQEEIPDYRKLRGALRAYNPLQGWIPAMIPKKDVEEFICNRYIPNSLSELASFCSQEGKELQFSFSGEMQEHLNQMYSFPMPFEFALFIPIPAVKDIIEKVKTAVLEWTIRLEKEGIIGEDLRFDSKEKDLAQHIPQTINYYYGNTNIINTPLEQATIVVGNETSVNFSYEDAAATVSKIEDSLRETILSTEDKDKIEKMLADIKEKISQKEKPKSIKTALESLRDFSIGVGASATVAFIQAYLQGII